MHNLENHFNLLCNKWLANSSSPFNSPAQNSELPAVMDSDMFTEFAYQTSSLSLILLVLTVGLSGSVYLCVLRYICTGCCQPVVVGPEDESISGVVWLQLSFRFCVSSLMCRLACVIQHQAILFFIQAIELKETLHVC